MIAGCRRRSQRFCRPSKGGRYGVSGEWHEDNITPRYSQGWGVASRVDSDPFGPKSVSAHISIESNGTSPHPHTRRVGSGRVASGSPRSLQAPPGWSRSARRPPPRRLPAVRTGTGCPGRPSASVARCRERARPVPDALHRRLQRFPHGRTPIEFVAGSGRSSSPPVVCHRGWLHARGSCRNSCMFPCRPPTDRPRTVARGPGRLRWLS